MKAVVNIIRIIVGLLFIFSGLVKANDPYGLSYKMQEFFEVWKLHGFDSWTLSLSILMNAFEIIAGVALLIGWRIKLFSWLLLLLIIFFTFLTGYTYFTGEPKNCGCFGDCLLISSKTSFLKDVALTILIGFLIGKQKYIRPLLSAKAGIIIMLLAAIISFGIQWYALKYLPFVDCLPFKKGNNIGEKMKMPANAIPDSTVITFVYEKNGKPVEFTATSFPADFDSTYIFKNRYDKVVRKGKNNEPPIKGFSLSGTTNVDSTQTVLEQPTAILLFCENFSTSFDSYKNDFEKIYATASEKNIRVYVITSAMNEALQHFSSYSGVQIFKCDYTTIRTAARVNPTVYILEKGTVIGKWSYKQFGNAINLIQQRPAMEKQEPIEQPASTMAVDSSNNKDSLINQ